MSRRHGWELPADPSQVVAITGFILLSGAFYAFFAPFLGKEDIHEYVALGVYSLLALSVFILYVRCTAIDPSDPGILGTSAYISHSGTDLAGNTVSVEESGEAGLRNGEESGSHNASCYSMLGGFFCGFLVKEDCCKDEDHLEEETGDEDGLYCTLCKADVRKFSKHCRKCDKCVDGFDHHCRWLTNCVGRKNYVTFVCLMAVSLIWLVVEFGVGVAVLVRCFVDRKGTEDQIIDKLGVRFTRIPIVIVVTLCIAVSCLATVHLGDLFIFHMILIRKGITTYEYVVAMRTQSEAPGPSEGGDLQSLNQMELESLLWTMLTVLAEYISPCFVKQDEIIPHLEPGCLPSTTDPDATQPSDKGRKMPQRSVRISAWKLAKLDSKEAIDAGAKARASSSVLHPVSSRHHPYNADHLSSSNISGRSSLVTSDLGFHDRNARAGMSRAKSSYRLSRTSREDTETCGHSLSNMSSPHLSNLTTSPFDNRIANRDHFNPIYRSSASQSPRSAKQSEGNENSLHMNVPQHPGRKNLGAAESTKSSVYGDRELEAGGFISLSKGVGSSQIPGSKLVYTGRSIFFDGPIVNEQPNRGMGSGIVAPNWERGSTSNYYQQGRSQRGGQLPVFLPSDNQRLSQFP
ncbi:protein S-acyltransferase 21-like [Eucalyptus grandis]|uniref:protein S-acyltransferase 21-like n=1 Tax=Eucalyptus grandis TaxID=71139 RepID=UPI00192F0763|nr:protein S-acyltransferase 21-like [Eucalyptus grandis]